MKYSKEVKDKVITEYNQGIKTSTISKNANISENVHFSSLVYFEKTKYTIDMSLFWMCCMDYMTLKEASEKWSISPRMINYYWNCFPTIPDSYSAKICMCGYERKRY